MAQVIERKGTEIDDAGFIHHDDQAVSWEQADQIAGRRLDRRRNYAVIDGEICIQISWSNKCSGCCDDDPYSKRGCGCEECGYTGRSRGSSWIPESMAQGE